MMGLHRVNAKRTTDSAGGKHPSGGLDHPVEIHPGKCHTFVLDIRNLVTSFKQLGEELFARDGIVGQVMMRLFVVLKRNGIVDFVFGEHGL